MINTYIYDRAWNLLDQISKIISYRWELNLNDLSTMELLLDNERISSKTILNKVREYLYRKLTGTGKVYGTESLNKTNIYANANVAFWSWRTEVVEPHEYYTPEADWDWQSFPRTSDADLDTWIDSQRTYTHAILVNQVSATINGVEFNIWWRNNSSRTGQEWSSIYNNVNGNSLGPESNLIEEDFKYNVSPRTITLSGLRPGQKYIFVNFQWDRSWSNNPVTRTIITDDLTGKEIDFVRDTHAIQAFCFISTGRSRSFTYSSPNASTPHLYGFVCFEAPIQVSSSYPFAKLMREDEPYLHCNWWQGQGWSTRALWWESDIVFKDWDSFTYECKVMIEKPPTVNQCWIFWSRYDWAIQVNRDGKIVMWLRGSLFWGGNDIPAISSSYWSRHKIQEKIHLAMSHNWETKETRYFINWEYVSSTSGPDIMRDQNDWYIWQNAFISGSSWQGALRFYRGRVRWRNLSDDEISWLHSENKAFTQNVDWLRVNFNAHWMYINNNVSRVYASRRLSNITPYIIRTKFKLWADGTSWENSQPIIWTPHCHLHVEGSTNKIRFEIDQAWSRKIIEHELGSWHRERVEVVCTFHYVRWVVTRRLYVNRVLVDTETNGTQAPDSQSQSNFVVWNKWSNYFVWDLWPVEVYRGICNDDDVVSGTFPNAALMLHLTNDTQPTSSTIQPKVWDQMFVEWAISLEKSEDALGNSFEYKATYTKAADFNDIIKENNRITIVKLVNWQEKKIMEGIIRGFDSWLHDTKLLIDSKLGILQDRIIYNNYTYSGPLNTLLQNILDEINTREDTWVTLSCDITETVNKEYKKWETVFDILDDLANNKYEYEIIDDVLVFASTIGKDRTTDVNGFVEFQRDRNNPWSRNIADARMKSDKKEIATAGIGKSGNNYTTYEDTDGIDKFWRIERAITTSWDEDTSIEWYVTERAWSIREYTVEPETQDFFVADIGDQVKVFIDNGNEKMFFDWSMTVVGKTIESWDLEKVKIKLSTSKVKVKDFFDKFNNLQSRVQKIDISS